MDLGNITRADKTLLVNTVNTRLIEVKGKQPKARPKQRWLHGCDGDLRASHNHLNQVYDQEKWHNPLRSKVYVEFCDTIPYTILYAVCIPRMNLSLRFQNIVVYYYQIYLNKYCHFVILMYHPCKIWSRGYFQSFLTILQKVFLFSGSRDVTIMHSKSFLKSSILSLVHPQQSCKLHSYLGRKLVHSSKRLGVS